MAQWRRKLFGRQIWGQSNEQYSPDAALSLECSWVSHLLDCLASHIDAVLVEHSELGPCSVHRESHDSPVELKYNPHAWNRNATVIYLDQVWFLTYPRSRAQLGYSLSVLATLTPTRAIKASITLSKLLWTCALLHCPSYWCLIYTACHAGTRFLDDLVRSLQPQVWQEFLPHGRRIVRWSL